MKASMLRCAPLLCTVLVLAGGAPWTVAESEPATCCGQQESRHDQPEAATSASRATHVCPRYVSMNYGSYCTYYSQLCPGCQLTSFNSTNCMLATNGNCMDTVAPVCEGCVGLRTGELRADDPGVLGYETDLEGKQQRQKELMFSQVEKSIIGKVKVKELDTFVIKFLGGPNGKTAIFAQVFIVKVDPLDKSESEAPTAYLGSGIEIEKPKESTPIVDLTTSIGAVTCISGRPYAYRYHHGDMNVEVIVFKDEKNKHSCGSETAQ